MRQLVNLISGVGNWLISLSDRARLQLTIVALLILLGGGIYKLVRSVDRLSQPMPTATPEQLLKPMESLFERTKGNISKYQHAQHRNANRLDSLARIYTGKNHSPE